MNCTYYKGPEIACKQQTEHSYVMQVFIYFKCSWCKRPGISCIL